MDRDYAMTARDSTPKYATIVCLAPFNAIPRRGAPLCGIRDKVLSHAARHFSRPSCRDGSLHLEFQPAFERGFHFAHDASIKFSGSFADKFSELHRLDALVVDVSSLKLIRQRIAAGGRAGSKLHLPGCLLGPETGLRGA
jgi:hypothetical protein